MSLVHKAFDRLAGRDAVGNDVAELMRLRAFLPGHGFSLRRLLRMRKYNRICRRNNCFIPQTVKMGKDILFPHGLSGVFISRGAVIGDRCTLFHQVTIGSNRLADTRSFGSPVIGNDVYIGAGAKIIGGVTVGNNVRIGANAVIVKDIPDNATVVTERVRVIPHDGARDNRFERYRE